MHNRQEYVANGDEGPCSYGPAEAFFLNNPPALFSAVSNPHDREGQERARNHREVDGVC